jgi:hypothetical protein
MKHTHIALKLGVGLLATLFFAAVFLIAYTGNGSVYLAFVDDVPGKDKTGHVVMIGCMSLLLSWLSSFRFLPLKNVRLYYGIVAVFIFITIEEFLQLLAPYRSFDLIDLSCNYLGILLAHLICLLIGMPRSKVEMADVP